MARLFYIGELEELKRIEKDGFPPEPPTAWCLVHESDARKATRGEGPLHALRISLKGKLMVNRRAMRGMKVEMRVSDLNKGTRSFLMKPISSDICEKD